MARSLIREPAAAQYETIRKYVIGQIARAGDAPMRLASSREIAERFGVTHPTVIKAVSDLVADGLLSVRPGIGTFTNPSRLLLPRDGRLIAIVFGDGRNVFLDRSYWRFASLVAEELMRRRGRFQTQHTFLASRPAAADDELLKTGVDGILWFYPDIRVFPAMARLRAGGMPMLALGERVPGVPSLSFDWVDFTRTAVATMLAEGRRRLAVLHLAHYRPMATGVPAGVAAALAGTGLPPETVEVLDGRPEIVAARLPDLRPDGLVLLSPIPSLWEALRPFLPGCRLWAGEFTVPDDLGYAGYLSCPDLASAALVAVDDFLAQFDTPAGRPVLDAIIRRSVRLV